MEDLAVSLPPEGNENSTFINLDLIQLEMLEENYTVRLAAYLNDLPDDPAREAFLHAVQKKLYHDGLFEESSDDMEI